jgi:hypothetical protein
LEQLPTYTLFFWLFLLGLSKKSYPAMREGLISKSTYPVEKKLAWEIGFSKGCCSKFYNDFKQRKKGTTEN